MSRHIWVGIGRASPVPAGVTPDCGLGQVACLCTNWTIVMVGVDVRAMGQSMAVGALSGAQEVGLGREWRSLLRAFGRKSSRVAPRNEWGLGGRSGL